MMQRLAGRLPYVITLPHKANLRILGIYRLKLKCHEDCIMAPLRVRPRWQQARTRFKQGPAIPGLTTSPDPGVPGESFMLIRAVKIALGRACVQDCWNLG